MNKRLQRLKDAYSIAASRGDLYEMGRIRHRILRVLMLLAAQEEE